MLDDLRYAGRVLRKSPGFTFAAIAALALGIGATTAMFGAINSVLLRPLPFPHADRLFMVRETRSQAGFERTVVSEGEYLRWARGNPQFEHAAVVETPGLSVRLGDAPEHVAALRVPADFFPLFGIRPAAGGVFDRDAEHPGRGDVILLSYDIWQRRMNGAADAIGRSVAVDGRPATIIGILPEGFTFGERIDAVVPMALGPSAASQFSSHWLDLFVRLAPGVTPEQAAADLTRTVLATQGTPVHATGVALVPLQEEVVGDSGTAMLILFGAVGVVLLIACANIANLLLARASARQKEIALRAALGATRGRVIQQLVTESLLLSMIGGICGAVLSLWLTDSLARVAADTLPRAAEIGIDVRALTFAFVLSACCGLLFGLAPAWQAARLDPATALKQEGRGGTAAGRARALAVFVTAEIALALVLLVGAGLLLATFRNLRRVDAGFDPSSAVSLPTYLPGWKYATPDAQRAFFRRAIAELSTLPGVKAAAAVNVLPLSGNNSSGAIAPEGFPPPPPDQRESADRRAITPAYFSAMGIRLLQGRAFTDSDGERGAPVGIVSRSLAEHYWPGTSAVGKHVKLGRHDSTAPWLTIVGVAEDVRHGTLAKASRQAIYYPHAQLPSGDMEIVVRGERGAVDANAIRQTIRRLDPDLPVDAIQPLTALVRASLFDQELEIGLLGTFALMALALAAAGIYGVMSYAIAQRVPEFGIRMALGASAADILRLVASYAARVTGAGLAIGLVVAWASSSILTNLLYGVQATDPLVFAATACLLALVALAACIAPARRALGANPASALRD